MLAQSGVQDKGKEALSKEGLFVEAEGSINTNAEIIIQSIPLKTKAFYNFPISNLQNCTK